MLAIINSVTQTSHIIKWLLIIRELGLNMFLSPNKWPLLYFSDKEVTSNIVATSYFFERVTSNCNELLFLKVTSNL